MHIVQLANFYGPRSGGLRTAVDRLAAGYCAAGHHVTTIVPAPSDAELRVGSRTMVEISSPIAPLLGGDYRMIVDRRAVDRAIERADPDVIELSDKTSLVAPAVRRRERRGTPIVLFSHERLDDVVARATRIPASRSILERYHRWLTARVDAAVCASAYAAAELERHLEHVEHVPLGVDLERFRPRSRPAREAPRIIAAVRLSPEKNPGLLVETSRALLEGGCEHEMVVYGDGPLRHRLVARARGLPIEFAGFLSDRSVLADEMATADAGIAPGPLETFGLAALELLASGTPVVVPDRGALAEIADGRCAVAAEGTGPGFAAALETLLAGDRHLQRAAARELAEGYRWDHTVDRMLEIFGRASKQCETRRQSRSYL